MTPKPQRRKAELADTPKLTFLRSDLRQDSEFGDDGNGSKRWDYAEIRRTLAPSAEGT